MRQLVAQENTDSSVNYQTNISGIFREAFGIFRSIQIILLFLSMISCRILVGRQRNRLLSQHVNKLIFIIIIIIMALLLSLSSIYALLNDIGR